MGELVTHVGVGGILAILVIREVLNFLKARNGEASRNYGISRDEFDRHKTEVRYRDTCDDRHEAIQRQFADLRSDLSEIKDLIRSGGK